MIRYSPLLAVFAALTITPSSYAQDERNQCFLPDNIPAQPSLDTWLTLRPLLAKQLDNCLHSSEYFALYGASLLYTGDTSKAVEMLERSLLINPDNGSARIDYAQALFQSDQLISALQVNEELLREQDIPAPLYAYLEKRHQAWSEYLHYWQTQFTYLYGHSSNLNNATHVETLYLTRLGQRFPANLTPDFLAQSGHYHYISVLSQYYGLKPDGTDMLSFSLNTRESKLNQSDTDEFKLTYERDFEYLHQRNRWAIGLEHLRLGDKGLYSALEGKLTIYPRSETRSYIEFEGRYVDFTGQSLLDEMSLMVRPGVSISNAGHRVGFELGLGLNNEIDDRSGGNRSQQEASVYYDVTLFGGRLSSRIGYIKTRDKEGYSPLFEANTRRETQSVAGTLQYFYPVNQDWLMHGSYYYRDQESNISLFKTKTESFDVGFTYRF
ncbi:tetratricopeptide repeat protein [Marinomonas atlantica]|uniref:tetratricopeptide repeat protein n=1 Tax=Marinomonas atlantica TaxID=1806668 RepID=UPI0008374380|nr:tetratricopeptide repeat protein [Marinomonas atlantica]MCO4784959.1 tetratricopeptide repeat protein [Marinomonas atlantica]